jgi:hypothetical protein
METTATAIAFMSAPGLLLALVLVVANKKPVVGASNRVGRSLNR